LLATILSLTRYVRQIFTAFVAHFEIGSIMEKILIVDDEVDICYFLSRNLNRKNFDASYVNTLREARIAISESSPSIILLDNHLPDGLGMDFAAEIKKDYPSLKIVMITAHDTTNDRYVASENGINSFLSKPFMMTEVFNAIEEIQTLR
jgi:DNA-binding response OmpR family regulator